MNKQTEALKMAIEAFDWEKVNKKCKVDVLTMVMDFSNNRMDASHLMDAIAYRCQVTLELAYKQACKEALASNCEALAQPAQEPFGYFTALPFGWTDCGKDDEGAIALYEHPAQENKAISLQEPVAFTNEDELSELQSGMTTCYMYKQAIDNDDIPLYTHPAPSWQGLSDDEVQEVFNLGHKTFKEFARAIEQALKEKNGR